jgi:hypothetical protein
MNPFVLRLWKLLLNEKGFVGDRNAISVPKED